MQRGAAGRPWGWWLALSFYVSFGSLVALWLIRRVAPGMIWSSDEAFVLTVRPLWIWCLAVLAVSWGHMLMHPEASGRRRWTVGDFVTSALKRPLSYLEQRGARPS